MSNILVITLSDKIYEKKIFQTKEYFLNNEKIYREKNEYYPTCYFNKFGFDAIIFIGTLNSSWDYAYNELISLFIDVDEKNKEKEIEKIRKLKTEKEFYDYFNSLNSDYFSVILMDEEKDYKNISNKLFEMAEMISKYDKVYIDITGGLRNQAISVMLLLTYLKNSDILKNSELVLLGQYFDNEITKIVDISDNLYRDKILNKMNALLKYGNPNGIEDLNISEIDLELFNDIYLAQQLNLVNNLIFSLSNAKVQTQNTNSIIINSTVKYLKKQWNEISKNILNQRIPLIKMLIENNYYKDNLGLIFNNLNMLYGDENIKKLKDYRDQIVHSYSSLSSNFENEIINIEKELLKILKKEKILKLKESKILFWNLGKASEYSKLKYKYNGKNIESKYSIYAYLNENYKKIFIIGVSTSGWKEILEDLINVNNKKELLDLFSEENLTEGKINLILEKLDSRFKAVIIDSGIKLEERNAIYEKISNILESLDNDTIYNLDYDITHGFRTTAILLLTTLHFFELLYKNIKIKDIKYAHKKEGIEIASIYSNTELLEIIKVFKNMDDFEKYAKFNKKDNWKLLINNSYILKYMGEISNIFKFNDIKKLKNFRKDFNIEKKKIEKLNNLERKIFFIIEKFVDSIPIKEKERKIFFIKEQLNKKNLAFSLFNLIDLYYYDFLNKKNFGKKKETFIKIKNKINEIAKNNNYQKVSELNNLLIKLNTFRNDSAHTNFDRKGNVYKISILDFNEKILRALELIEDDDVIKKLNYILKEMGEE